MDFNELIKYRPIVRNNMDELLKNDEFDLSIRYLTTIHEYLFKNILFNNGHFRHFNIFKEEEILKLNTIDYPDYHTIPTYLRFAINDQLKLDYSKMNMDEVIMNIAKFISELWVIHPFSDGNTRTTGLFVEKYLKSMGYNVNHDIFKENAIYFREALVRANYENEDLGIKPNYDALINFYNKVLVDSRIELDRNYLYIPELFEEKKKKEKKKRKLYLKIK